MKRRLIVEFIILIGLMVVGVHEAFAGAALVARWQFENNTSNDVGGDAADLLTKGSGSVVYSSTVKKFGDYSLELTSDGLGNSVNGGYVRTNVDQTRMDLSKSFSVSIWANFKSFPEGDNGWHTLFSAFYPSQMTGATLSLLNGGMVQFALFYNPFTWDCASATEGGAGLQANTWYNITIVHDAESRAVNLYVDGNLVNSSSYSEDKVFFSTAQYYLGAVSWGGDTSDFYRFINGYMDDVQFYTGVLTQSEIQNKVMNGLAASAMPPVFSPAYSVISGAKSITITCPTPNATIRYTTDGTDPTETTGTAITSGGSVNITVTNTTLKARAYVDGINSSAVTSVTYTIPTSYNRPWAIGKSNSITVDGNLSEWNEKDFVPLDKTYDGAGASDVTEAYYAAKWGSDGKIYVAVKALDTAHIFTSNYTAWDARDAVEVYLHTQGTIGGYYQSWEIAQQYVVGINSGTTNQVWTSLGDTGIMPESANFQAAGKVDGNWLYYEMAMTPFDYFGGYINESSIVTALTENDVIGLDVCIVSNDGQSAVSSGYTLGYTGMKCENYQTDKSGTITSIGLHKLVKDDPFMVLQWGPIVPQGTASSAYYLNDNIVDGCVLGGTLSSGPWEVDKSGNVVKTLSNTNTAKSVVKVGNYLYYTYSGGSDYVYRSSANTWDAGTAVTVSDSKPLASLATDGTYIYASTSKNTSGYNQIMKYSVDDTTGALTLVWTTSGIDATGVRGLSYYHGSTDYIYAVSGGRNAASVAGNTAHIYAIRTDTGVVTDMGVITDNGETYQIVRNYNQLWVADAYNATDGQIYIYDLTDSTTLVSTTPTTICNPDGIGPIYGMAMDDGFVWLSSASGQVYGYKFSESFIPGDANGDLVVDVGDLGILAANYGKTSGATWSQGDFNGDGAVDVGDLGILAANYGTNASGANFDADYAKVFGTASEENIDEDANSDSSLCSSFGLSLIAGLAMLGLMIVKMEE